MRVKAGVCPGPNIVARAAAGNADRASRVDRVRSQKVDQTRSGSAFFPRHIAGLITQIPNRCRS